MNYDYMQALISDIEDFLIMNDINICDLDEEEYDNLYDELWDVNSVTGNLSGYTSEEQATEWVGQNLRLALLAMLENGYDKIDLTRKNLATFIDTVIRTYLLGDALAKVKELKKDERIT